MVQPMFAVHFCMCGSLWNVESTLWIVHSPEDSVSAYEHWILCSPVDCVLACFFLVTGSSSIGGGIAYSRS